jgi:aspartate-semialdehyde dehydrogenase
VKVLDDPATAVYPMPALATGDDALLVGRIRVDTLSSTGIRLVAAMDGARASASHAVAALEAVARARQAH